MIYSEDHNDIYIGSTKKSIGVRLKEHECNYRQHFDDKAISLSSYDVLDKGNYKIKLINESEYDSLKQLRKHEGNMMKIYMKDAKYNVVNKVIAGRTMHEYYIDNAEKIKQRVKEYASNNIDEIKIRGQNYRAKNADKIKTHKNNKSQCDCGGSYSNGHKQRHMRTTKHMQYQQPIIVNITNLTINNN